MQYHLPPISFINSAPIVFRFCFLLFIFVLNICFVLNLIVTIFHVFFLIKRPKKYNRFPIVCVECMCVVCVGVCVGVLVCCVV